MTPEIVQEIARTLGMRQEDVINLYPICIDGCPSCIGVPYCSSGKDEQYLNISLKVARKFIDTIVMKTENRDEAVKAILRGGRLVEYDGRTYTILLI